MNYFSKVYDLQEYRTLCWSFEVGANLDGGNTTPATMYLQASDDEGFVDAWEELIAGGESPTVASTARGTVTCKARYVRVRIEVEAGQAVAVAVWLLARHC
jgi:hypothetical protein